jgi:alpha-ketoglutarate-dependent taurine dioxygenase
MGGAAMAETRALSAELGAELVDYGDREGLLDDTVIAQCRKAWATQSQSCYAHAWSVGDAVLWDNTAVLHRALPYDPTSDRMLRRTHIKGREAWA